MKKLNKWIAGLLCMMLVITMVAGLGVMEVKADDAVTTVSSWTELKNAISKGGNIQLGNDIVAETGNSAACGSGFHHSGRLSDAGMAGRRPLSRVPGRWHAGKSRYAKCLHRLPYRMVEAGRSLAGSSIVEV